MARGAVERAVLLGLVAAVGSECAVQGHLAHHGGLLHITNL